MSPRRTRRGTVRDSSVNDTSVDTSINFAPKSVRTTRQTRRHQIDTNLEEIGSSFSNESLINNKKQRRKAKESILSQEDSSLSAINDSKTKRRNLKTPEVKKQTKSSKSNITKSESLISEDESFNAKSKNDKKRVSYSIDNLISEDEDAPQVLSKKKAKIDHHDSKKVDKSTTKATNPINNVNVTPKSSPINVSFTPHRSTKTPKKSPINLGSPKSLPRKSLELLNIPRKLVIVDSPPSDNSINNLTQPKASTSGVNKSAKNTRMNKSKITKRKSESPTLKVRPRFSKSPKIVLKSPKGKGTKSKSNSSKKSRSITPTKTKNNTSLTGIKNIVKSTSPKKTEKSPSKTAKSPKNSSTSPNRSLTNSLLKAEKTPKHVSPEKIKKSSEKTLILQKSESPNKSVKTSKTNSTLESQDSTEKSIQSLNDTSSNKSQKSLINTSFKSKNSSFNTSFNFKKSPGLLSLSSKKMPKIVLNLKSKKSHKRLTPSKLKKSPLKSPKNISPSKLKKSPSKSPRNISPSKVKKLSESLSPVKKLNIKSNVNCSISQDTSLSPRVLINKLSSPGIEKPNLNVSANQPSIKLIPVDHQDQQSIHGCKNSKSPKSLAKRSTIKSATPSKSVRTSIATAKVDNPTNTPFHFLERKLLNIQPASTSTPREKNFQRNLTLASNKKVTSPKLSVILNGLPASKSKIIKRLNNQSAQADHPLLEDVSAPFLDGSSLIPMSDVFDSDNSKNNSTFEIKKNSSTISPKEKTQKKDDTYELENPKTPALQKRCKKRTLDEAELDTTREQESKRTCRVHFVSPHTGNQVQTSGINRMGTPGHAIQQKRTPVSMNQMKTPVNEGKTKQSLGSVSKSQSKIAANTSMNRRKSQIASVNRLSKPKSIINSEKKLGSKTPIVTKIPNFAEIHQKNFAKMESLVDLKKRVEKRHEVLNTATSSAKKKNLTESGNVTTKRLPPDSTDSTYNRFGFKLRKNNAVDIINKKQTGVVESREKKREDARNTLKGVRMNRRFELQMKSRIKNT